MSERFPQGLSMLDTDDTHLGLGEDASASSSSTPPSQEHISRVSPAESHDYSCQPTKRSSITLAPTGKRELSFNKYFSEQAFEAGNRHSAPELRNFPALVTDFGSWPREPQEGDTVVRPPLPPHPHPDDVRALPWPQDKTDTKGGGNGRAPAADTALPEIFADISLGGAEGVGRGGGVPLPALTDPSHANAVGTEAGTLHHRSDNSASTTELRPGGADGLHTRDRSCGAPTVVLNRSQMPQNRVSWCFEREPSDSRPPRAPVSAPLPGGSDTLTPKARAELLAHLLVYHQLAGGKPCSSPLQSPDFVLSPDSQSAPPMDQRTAQDDRVTPVEAASMPSIPDAPATVLKPGSNHVQ